MDGQNGTPVTRPTHNDVDQVRDILLTRVPYELADLILSEAQYWARLSTKRDTFLQIQASDELLHNAKWVYMISDPIPTVYNGDRALPTKVKSVQFSLKSCDQGWGGYSEDRSTHLHRLFQIYYPGLTDFYLLLDTFRNSYTWFEASILRPGDDDSRSTQPIWMKEAQKGPVNITTFTDYDLGLRELRSPYKSRNRRWLVQMNAQASRHTRRYEIAWSNSSSATGSQEPEYDEKNGSGRGLEFVETLQAGDRIALVARALVKPFFVSFASNVLLTMHAVPRLGKPRPQC